jgi:hypothetical protein
MNTFNISITRITRFIVLYKKKGFD